MTELRVKRIDPRAQLPAYAKPGDAGMDLRALEPQTIPPGACRLVRTGLVVEIPPGFEGQVRPRSGLALKHAVTVLNTPGTVDSGYRGEVGVILVNHGTADFAVAAGDRVAQFVLARFETARVVEADDLSRTERGEGGFGSSGRS